MSRTSRAPSFTFNYDKFTKNIRDVLRLQLPSLPPHILESRDNGCLNLENVEEHFRYRSASEPWCSNKDKKQELFSASQADINAISMTFPGVQRRETILAMAAWLSFLCTIDDFVEAIDPGEARQALLESIQVLSLSFVPNHDDESVPVVPDVRVRHVVRVFCRHLQSLLRDVTYHRVTESARDALHGIMEETAFRAQGGAPTSVDEYMKIRVRTIGIAPLVALWESELLPDDHIKSGALREMEAELNVIIGLQNDVLGLEKDLREGEVMNFVVVDSGVKTTSSEFATEYGDTKLRDSVTHLISRHNERLQVVRQLRDSIMSREEQSDEKAIAETLYLLSATHFYWASAAQRYHIEQQPEQ